MNFYKRCLACFLAIIIAVPMILPARAENNASVLTSIGHEDANTVEPGANRAVTLTVSAGYSGDTLDLSDGLDLDWDEDLYSEVVAEPSGTGVVNIGDGSTIVLSVSFLQGDDTERSTTVYTISVDRAAAVAPAFSGTIVKTGGYPGAVTFSASDFQSNYDQNDGEALGAVSITGSNLVVGGFQVAEENYNLGEPIEASTLDALKFVTASSGTVSYYVKAYAGTYTAASEPVGMAILTITVSALSVPAVEGDISKSVAAGSSLSFSSSTFTNCCNLNGGELVSVQITPTNSSYGSWYVNQVAFTGAKIINASELNTLSFTGTAAGSATFQWSASNEAGYSAYGTGTINVSAVTLTLSSYSASSLMKGDTWAISASHFGYSPAAVSIAYVKISATPSSSDGYLYLATSLPKNDTYGYPAITAEKTLSTGAVIPYSYLGSLRLATKSASKNSYVSFAWTATGDSAVKTAAWAAEASYKVTFTTAGTVSYDADLNTPVTLDAADFSEEFVDQTDEALSYVTFTLPNVTYGKLYFNYDTATGKGTAVSTSTKYYKGATPYLSYVSFVPTTGYTGTVSVSYNAYASDGTYATGTLKITISNSAGGIVSYTTDKNSAVQLDASDFAAAFKNVTEKTLSYVKFTLPSSSYGKLYYNYSSSSSYDSTVSSSTKYFVYSSSYLSYVSFVPYVDYTGTASITYYGYTSDGDSYKGKLKIYVVDSPAGIVSYSVEADSTLLLSADDFADEFIGVTGSVLSYVKFTLPAATVGALYTDYSDETGKGTGTKVTASASYYIGSSPDISDITFVPVPGYIGTATIAYTAYSTGGDAYAGKLKITIGEVTAGTVSYTSEDGLPIALKGGDFGQEFYTRTGSNLSYVLFSLPSYTYGKLYYGYHSSSDKGSAVSESVKYYVNGMPSLYSIAFVPYSTYSGSFSITYTGYDLEGNGYTGKLKITVGSSDVGTVNYETNLNTKITFAATDFSTPFYSETGETLSYIKFVLPSTAYGRLYYSYSSSSDYDTQVSSATKYYKNSYPYLSQVSFVPCTGYSGTVIISYTAYDSDGDSSAGTVVINVGGSDGGTVSYETDGNTPVSFDAADFNTAFESANGETLSCVKFTLPSSSYGKLYYNYTSATDYGSVVSSSSLYYRNASPYLSKVTFVPYENYTGTFAISYKAYDSDGNSYSSSLLITVNSRSAGTVQYGTEEGTPVTLDGDDFNTVFLSGTGSTLAYVKFTLPSSVCGKLYYSYSSAASYESAVSSSAKYYRSATPSLSKLTFVPYADYCGTVTIPYTAYNSGGDSYDGTLLIVVAEAIPVFSDMEAYSWAVDAVDYLYENGIVQGTGDGAFMPQTSLSRGDFILMIYRAFDLEAAASSTFSDVMKGSYYYDAVAAAESLGIVFGSEGKFHPAAAISRQDAMVILMRALTASGTALESGSGSNLSAFSDTGEISDYAYDSIAALVKAGIVTGSEGKINPRGSINRAEMAVILYRALTL